MTLFDNAQQELRLLESHWISLLAWLCEEIGVSPDDLVQAWNADEYDKASHRLADETKNAKTKTQWSVLHFVDFGRYSELAGKNAVALESVGSPPPNWRDNLAQQAKAGLVRFRNHLQHANRFLMLPQADQQRCIDLLHQQRTLLQQWWPDCPVQLKPRPAESSLRAALRSLGPDPADALPLMEELGLHPLPNAMNLINLTGVPTPLTGRLKDDLEGLYKIGDAELGSARAAVYLACLKEWEQRSSKREPVRRRVAKELRDQAAEEQRVIILVDGRNDSPGEVEFVLPRVRAGKGVGTVRAFVSVADPTRHHIDLLESLRVNDVETIPALARKWIEAFSVERVTTLFYTEFRELRDRLIDDLLENNAKNPALKGRTKTDLDLLSFGTRQLSRILFLWFLQQKRWLGGSSPNDGKPNFLTDLFRDSVGAKANYFADVLTPLCFDGLGTRQGPKRKAAIERFGGLPYLGGGIFSPGANEFEAQLFGLNDDGERTRRVVLSDDLFDPRKDEADGKGKGRKRTVLGLLRGYRFTTQESTPDDQSIDPDPELLGKVFENLYQADQRHSTGAYYTPREIVQFMCRRTLDGYLQEQTGVTQETIDQLREEAVDWQATNLELSQTEASDLIFALERVRVLDPAVGSGAFLLTMMHEIVTLWRGIGSAEQDQDVPSSSVDVADRKRRIATSSLYGVDINPMAVEICHLRLWLSIIVDLEVSSFNQIPALPNLDFRIVAGDSLIDRMGEEPFFESLPRPDPNTFDMIVHQEVKSLQTSLDGLKYKFAAEGTSENDAKNLRKLRQRIREKQVAIAKVQIEQRLRHARDHMRALGKPKAKKPTKKQLADATARVGQLEALEAGIQDDSPYLKPFLWPVNFHEVFAKEAGGFDIVLANPPYVRMEDIDNIDEAAYAHAFPEVTWTRADLLVYFYARAVQVLREGGQLAFITSNKYMRAEYGWNIRAFLPANLQLRQVIDFGDLPLFDAAAYPAVLIGAKTAQPDGDQTLQVADLVYPVRRRLAADDQRVNVDNVRLVLEDLVGLLDEAAVNDYPQALLRREGWILEAPALVYLFERLMSQGTPLGEFVKGKMYYGIKTGLNEAFVIDEAKRAELIASDPRSAELTKRWLRGRDIKRWQAQWAGLHIIFARRGTEISDYPAVRKHLTKYKAALEKRATAHLHPWYELQQPQEGCYAEFEKPKIVWPDIARSLRFAWDDSGAYFETTVFAIGNPPSWLLQVLNSKIAEFMFCLLTSSIRGGFMRLKLTYIQPLAARLSDLVDAAAAADDARPIENEINNVVFDLYRVDDQARELVQSWYSLRLRAETVGSVLAHGEDDD